MLVDVFSALKRDEIRQVLEENEEPAFHFVKMLRPMEMQFECDGDEASDPCRVVKRLIRKQPWGGVIAWRVLIHGQFFDGGKIYADDPVKLQMEKESRSLS